MDFNRDRNYLFWRFSTSDEKQTNHEKSTSGVLTRSTNNQYDWLLCPCALPLPLKRNKTRFCICWRLSLNICADNYVLVLTIRPVLSSKPKRNKRLTIYFDFDKKRLTFQTLAYLFKKKCIQKIFFFNYLYVNNEIWYDYLINKQKHCIWNNALFNIYYERNLLFVSSTKIKLIIIINK